MDLKQKHQIKKITQILIISFCITTYNCFGQKKQNDFVVVDIQSGRNVGKGLAFRGKGESFVLTMEHVISSMAIKNSVRFNNGKIYEVEKILPDTLLDFYLLKLPKSYEDKLPKRNKTKDISKLFSSNRNGLLLLDNNGEDESNVLVRAYPMLNNKKTLKIEVQNNIEEVLESGMSGAPVFLTDKKSGLPKHLIGFFHGEKTRGEGIVHRVDWFNSELNPFFENRYRKRNSLQSSLIILGVGTILSASSYLYADSKYNEAKEIYTDYATFQTQQEFNLNTSSFNSRESAFAEITSLHDQANLFRNISLGLATTAGSILLTKLILKAIKSNK